MKWRVPLSDVDFDHSEEQAVVNVIKSKWLTMGERTQEFEEMFAQFVGVRYAFAVSNATVALHLACVSLDIGPGDEVIVPSLTFVATSNSIIYTGADPIFAEVGGNHDLNISPDDIEKRITPKTKAISVVHFAGYPCQMEKITQISKKHNLALIEDCAHGVGTYLHGKHVGGFGDVGCFSFFSNKNLSIGEGGMIVTNRDDLAEKFRWLRSHGMTSLTWDRHKGHAYSYDVIGLGYNYRMDELRSALGISQLAKLVKNNQRRQEITDQYFHDLSGIGLTFPFQAAAGQSAYHIFPILLPENADRKKFIDSMRNQEVQTSIHYPPIHKFSYYQEKYPHISLPLTEEIAAREVTLPLYPGMDSNHVQIVVAAVKLSLDQTVDGKVS